MFRPLTGVVPDTRLFSPTGNACKSDCSSDSNLSLLWYRIAVSRIGVNPMGFSAVGVIDDEVDAWRTSDADGAKLAPGGVA